MVFLAGVGAMVGLGVLEALAAVGAILGAGDDVVAFEGLVGSMVGAGGCVTLGAVVGLLVGVGVVGTGDDAGVGAIVTFPAMDEGAGEAVV